MIYPADFPSKQTHKSVNPFIIYKRDYFHLRHKKHLRSTTNPISNNRNILDGEKDKNSDHKPEDLSFWERFCYHTTIHGIKYIAQKELHWSERLVWTILVVVALYFVVDVSAMLQKRFSSTPLATVVESIIFPVYEIPYPAITICNYNRVNWKKIDEARDKFIPNANNRTNELFINLVKAFANIEFGSFEEFIQLKNKTIIDLEHLNLTAVFETVMHKCDDLFEGQCWWINKYVECCTIFAEQKSEYGLCYAFNSGVNHAGKKLMLTNENYPLRTSSYGDWSGLRMTVKTDPTEKYPESTQPSGFLVIVHDPLQWPNSASFIPAGSATSIVIKPTYYYTSAGVHGLTPFDRQCIYPDEESFSTLPDTEYLRSNCVSECRQQHMLQYCNCTVDFFYPTGNYTTCNVSGLVCLIDYDRVLNFEKPPIGNKYFNDSDEGILCDCLPECHRVDFSIEVSPIALSDLDKNTILIDVHFQYATMVKYRTDVLFGLLDLTVAFGGIVGLFLGCSLLSIVEVVYFLTLGLFHNYHRKTITQSVNKKGRNDFIHESMHKQQLKKNAISLGHL